MEHALAAIAASSEAGVGPSLVRIEREIDAARAAGAAMVVFPEGAIGGYHGADRGCAEAFAVDGPEVARLCELAGEMVVCAGLIERGPGRPFASAVCVNGDGILGHHRKVHLPPGEAATFAPGDGFATFDTPIGRIGMLICYDKLFPEAARTMALEGAEVIASLSAWPLSRRDPARRLASDLQTRHFNVLAEVRAIENHVVWISSNLTGRVGSLRFAGQAKVVDPDGRIVARTRGRAGVAVGRIDPAEAIARSRAAVPHLADRVARAYRVDRPSPVVHPRPAPARTSAEPRPAPAHLPAPVPA